MNLRDVQWGRKGGRRSGRWVGGAIRREEGRGTEEGHYQSVHSILGQGRIV